jgi:hypothetical protein
MGETGIMTYPVKHVVMRGDISMDDKGYRKLTVNRERAGGARLSCFLCLKNLTDGEECFLVPVNCDETAKMQAGEEYRGELGHRNCVTAILGMEEKAS